MRKAKKLGPPHEYSISFLVKHVPNGEYQLVKRIAFKRSGSRMSFPKCLTANYMGEQT